MTRRNLIKNFAFLLLLILSVIPITHCFADETSSVQVYGEYRFKEGDDLQWSLPGFDDSEWMRISVPASWESLGIAPENGIGWYRIRFSITNISDKGDLGIFLGRIGDADEVFLNGEKIGGEGRVGTSFVEAGSIIRLYSIPPTLLKTNEGNLLAVRVMNIISRGGMYEGDITIGRYNDLLMNKAGREGIVKGTEIILLTICFTFLVLSVLTVLSGIHEQEFRTFTIFIILYGAAFFFSSQLFYQTGLKTHTVQKIIFSISSILPPIILVFICEAYREKSTGRIKGIIMLFVLLAILLLISFHWEIYHLLIFTWIVLVLFAIITAGHYSVRAIKRKMPESIPISIGVLFLFVGTLIRIAEVTGLVPIPDILYQSPSGFVMPFVIVCFIYAADIRFSRGLRRMKRFSERILIAHEEERKRLARELHDGLGQSLLTTKFNLQKMNQEKEDSLIEGLIEEISGNIEELREISVGLRPPFLEEAGLATTIKVYGDSLSEKTGMNVDIKVDLHSRPSALIEDNLFRILQETLGNAIKHSGAKNLKVTLTEAKDRVIMEVEDDGLGFDYLHALSKGRGIGFKTMEERVNLMNGIFFVRSSKGKGTIINVEVSLK